MLKSDPFDVEGLSDELKTLAHELDRRLREKGLTLAEVIPYLNAPTHNAKFIQGVLVELLEIRIIHARAGDPEPPYDSNT